MKRIVYFSLFIFAPFLSKGQDWSCDDFTSDDWISGTYMAEETVGYTQDGTQTVIVGTEGFAEVNAFTPGIYNFGPLDFSFDGTDQIARFEIYGFEGQYNEMGFAINGGAVTFMDGDFPMDIDGVTVELDDSAEDFDAWDNAYLTFTGDLDEISIIGFESGILSLCIAPAEDEYDGCDDFTDFDWTPDGDILGYTQGGLYPITTIDYGGPFGGDSWPWELTPPENGMYGITSGARFDFDGSLQTITFDIYGWFEEGTGDGFKVNGSEFTELTEGLVSPDASVEVELEITGMFGSFQTATFTLIGEITTIEMHCLESGIFKLCVGEPEEEYDGCDDFTAGEWADMEGYFGEEEAIGYTQDGTQTIVTGIGGSVWLGDEYYPGIGMHGPVNFSFDGSSQTATFEVYGWIAQYDEMGFSVNGGSTVFMDGTFPMTVDGITVDLDDSAPDFDEWDNAYLIFTGNLDEVSIIGFESGILSLCIEKEIDDLSIVETTTPSLELYPNPAKDIVTLTSTLPMKSVAIYTLSGELIFNQGAVPGPINVQLASVPAGFYLVTAELSDGTIIKEKLVVR